MSLDTMYQAERRKQLWSLLGDLPDRRRPIAVKQFSRETRDGYVLETLELDLNGIQPVPAYFAKPLDATGRLPTVLFNHSHGGDYTIGRQEFVDGRKYLQDPPYAKQLTGLGYNALVDTPMSQRAVNDADVQRYVATKQPLDGGRIGKPEDVDAAAVYFLSDQSKFVTGQVLAVDGGWGVSEGQHGL